MSERPDDIPQARVSPRGRWSIQLVWVIPIVAALIGAWLAVQAVLERGPLIAISFSNAEGLEADKTLVKYKNVDIGRVTGVSLSEDRARVIATVQMTKAAEDLLVEDTRFWVVRPRVTGAQVSGLGTLLSGAYIGVDVGKSQESRREYVGLDVPPIVTVDRPGRHFLLHADDLGSLDIGSPVYYRRVQVGQVVAFDLDADGGGVSVQVFVHAPHDRQVKRSTRFWQASGFDIALDASGIRLNTESIASLLLGGIAFRSPPGVEDDEAAAERAQFTLFADRERAMSRPDSAQETYVMMFEESVRGLTPGAPVDFRGVVLGEVVSVNVDFDPVSQQVRLPVEVRLYPERMRARYPKGAPAADATQNPVDLLVARGLRAQLRTGNLLTGQLYIALDFFPKAGKAAVIRAGRHAEIPTARGSLQEAQSALVEIARKLEKVPFDTLGADLQRTLNTLERTLAGAESVIRQVDADTVPQAGAALAELRRTLAAAQKTLGAAQDTLAGADGLLAEDAPMQRDLRAVLREVSRAAEALRSLADYLERNPAAILRGRSGEATP